MAKQRGSKSPERKQRKADDVHAVPAEHEHAAHTDESSGGVEKFVALVIVAGVAAIFVLAPASGSAGHGSNPAHGKAATAARTLEPTSAAEEEEGELEVQELEMEEVEEGEIDPELAEIAEEEEAAEAEEMGIEPSAEEEEAEPEPEPAPAPEAAPEPKPAPAAPTAAPKPAAPKPAAPKPAAPKPAAPKPAAPKQPSGDNPY